MKRVALALLLLGLVISEAYLCAAFLPMSWQLAIQRVLPETKDHSRITHPNLEGEIDQALRHHTALKIAFYSVLVLLLTANTLLVRLVWNTLRRTERSRS